jgi:hypothetical protein
MLELNGLQFLRVSRLRCNATHLQVHGNTLSKRHDNHSWLKMNAMAHLDAFEGVDQTALAHIWEANNVHGDALGRARFVRLEEAEHCRRGSRSEIRALVRARRAEGEHWGCVAEVFEPLGILARHEIYNCKHVREVPHNVDDQRRREGSLNRYHHLVRFFPW